MWPSRCATACDALAASGTHIDTADVIGGGSRSRVWIGIIAAALNVPLHRSAVSELGPAFGAARLARMAVTGEAAEAVCTPPAHEATFVPDAALAEAYASRVAQYRVLNTAIAGVIREG